MLALLSLRQLCPLRPLLLLLLLLVVVALLVVLLVLLVLLVVLPAAAAVVEAALALASDNTRSLTSSMKHPGHLVGVER